MAHTLSDPPLEGDRSTPQVSVVAGSVRSTRWTTIPLVLVVVVLLGSVLIPARQTWRIMHLLRETTDVIEPARLHGARLESGLIVEAAALEGFALTGDRAQRARYLAVGADDDRRLAAIEDLASMLDPDAIDRAAAVRSRVAEWREVSRGLVDGSVPRARLAAMMRAQQASYESALREVARLGSYLTAEGSARRDLIRGSERLGLLVNASLVFIALAAVFAVGALSYRERRLTRVLRRRIDEEAALGRLAQELGAADAAEDVMRHLAEGATATTHAVGAYVERLEPGGDDVEYLVHDHDSPATGCRRRPRPGSLTEALMARGSGGSLMQVDSMLGWMASDLAGHRQHRAGLVAPLTSSSQTMGALVILQNRASAVFGDDARRQMHILADLASAALQRVAVQAAERRALEEAERRARQEVALREAAEALAAAFTVDEVTQQIARTALEATQALGAFVEQVDAGTREESATVVVRASAGEGVPALGSLAPFGGSCTEMVLEGGEPVLIPDLARAERACMAATSAEAGCSAIAVPLANAGAPLGALFIVSATRTPFCPDDLTRAHTFGHLATLAYEKVRLLDEAREGRRELERVMRSRSRLMRGFSHDVKNPLGAADGYAALLTDGIFGPLAVAQTEGIERIRGCIHSALALIEDLHELGRAETGNIVISLEPVDLPALVRTSGDEYRAAAEACHLSLSVDVGPDPLAVNTDQARVRQIIGNLLSNAIKYTAEGSVRLRVRRQTAGLSGGTEGWAVIDVSDTGRGIAVEKLDAIFEEFIRVGTDEKSGAGLGLAISQRLAQALGGRITVKSEVGYGSTFTLCLPLQRSEGATSPAAPAVAVNGVPAEVPSKACLDRPVPGVLGFERQMRSPTSALSIAQ